MSLFLQETRIRTSRLKKPPPKALAGGGLFLDREIIEFIQTSCRGDRAVVPAGDTFQTLALKIFEYQFRKNKHYRNFCLLDKKNPKIIKHWKDIPAMPTIGFKELVLSTFPIRRAVKVFRTSGTTQSLRGAHFFDTLKLYEAAIIPPFKKYFLSDQASCAYFFLIHSPKAAPDSSLSHMMGVVNRQFAANRGRYYIKEGKPRFARLVRDLKSLKMPAFILSTAFSLKSFLDYLGSHRIILKLLKGSRIMETGGFKGRIKEISKRRLYAECEKLLGLDKNFCVSEYGMTELSSQFYESKGCFAGPPWTRTLVIDPVTGKEAKKGKIGILRHFDLANRGSVIAIQTEDLGRATGDGFQLIGRASGSELRGCSLTYEEFLRGC